MRVKALALWIDDQRGEVLDVPHLVLGAVADFVQRIPTDAARGTGRLEAQHLVLGVLLPPTGGQRPQLALQVGDDTARAPRQQRGHHQADALTRARGSEGKHVLRAAVPQIEEIAVLVLPAAHVHAGGRGRCLAGDSLQGAALARKQAGRLNVLLLGPAGRAVQVLVRLRGVGRDDFRHGHAQQAHGRNQDAHAAGLHDLVRVLAVPLVCPVQDRPGGVHVLHVRAKGGVIGERMGEELCRGLEAADQGDGS